MIDERKETADQRSPIIVEEGKGARPQESWIIFRENGTGQRSRGFSVKTRERGWRHRRDSQVTADGVLAPGALLVAKPSLKVLFGTG